MGPRSGRLGAVLAAFALAGLLACSHHVHQPTDTLERFTAALRKGDHAAAYALTSESFRARVGLDEFRRQIERRPGDPTLLAGAESALAAGPTRAEIRFPGDAAMTFVIEGGVWRIEALPAEPWSQATPAAALKTLLMAVKARRFDVVRDLAPESTRTQLREADLAAFWLDHEGAERLALLEKLVAQAASRMIEDGETAHLPYGDGAEARFVRQAGTWRVESL